jgi:tRNA1(Val) A37 N6-methylase TrmN6
MDHKEAVEVINDLLGYDGLKIIQRPDMFNFSLDSTLLADFVQINKKVKNIIDLGTGNAPIPLFLSLKTDAHIVGVDIQEAAYDLAKRSVALNGLDDQISIQQQDIKGIHKAYENGFFDVVTCNPPFFKYKETSNVNKNSFKTIARHEVLVKLEDVVREAKRLLTTKGSLYMVHRTERLMDMMHLLEKHKFSVKRLRFVYPKEGEESAMMLVEASNNGRTMVKVLPPLVVHQGDGYTEEVRSIFKYGKDVKR